MDRTGKIDASIGERREQLKKAPSGRRRRTIAELLQNYAGEYRPSEIEWGEPRGREIW
ncbi:MAG TPA: hypothetical protein IAD35_01655 [Candidatus Caccocola faecigallinarum]|nr:hypothetical protein [Candidatus Caccocola faecigallinarum]